MIASEFGSSGAPETSWFQARWSGSEAVSAGTSGPGRGKTPHLSPSDPGLTDADGVATSAAEATSAAPSSPTAVALRRAMAAQASGRLGHARRVDHARGGEEELASGLGLRGARARPAIGCV